MSYKAKLSTIIMIIEQIIFIFVYWGLLSYLN